MGQAKRKREQQQQSDVIADREFRQHVARRVRSVSLITPDSILGAGICTFRSLVGWNVLREHGVAARIHVGGLLYRVGPDPYRDVIAYCGEMNRGGYIGGQRSLFHIWIGVADDVVDFSVGDWREQVRNIDYATQEIQVPGAPDLGAIQWTIAEPPDFWWRPRREVIDPWRPVGSPEPGHVWYCPFFVSSDDVVRDRVRRIYADLRPLTGLPRAELPTSAIVVERDDAPPPGMHKVLLADLCRLAGYRVPEGTGDAHIFSKYVPISRTGARELLADICRRAREAAG
jgi:hypothetical protein